MADYICIDSGTTNTRISLVKNGGVVDTLKFHCGAKSGKDALKGTLKNGISDIISKNGVNKEDIKGILASGMITSELGLVTLPHIGAPAGIEELSSSVYETVIDDVSEIPFTFIRGVKTVGSTLEKTDIMRGEETELMGIFRGEGVYILPGSHSKIINVDGCGRIVGFKTMLTGEMLTSLSEHTVLKDSVKGFTAEIDEEYLFTGYEYAKKNGINEALFKVRVLKNIFSKSDSEVFSFLLGAVLCDEINYILCQDCKKIIIGGNRVFRNSMSVILSRLSKAEVMTLSDSEAELCVPMGQVRIFEYKNRG